MRKAIALLSLSIFMFLLSACSYGGNDGPGATKIDYIKMQGLTEGTYLLNSDSTNVFQPKIRFDFHNETFSFVYDVHSSYEIFGKFEVADKQVTCKTNDDKYTYIFDILDDETIAFVQNGSSQIEMTVGETLTTVTDGVEFKFMQSSEEIPVDNYIVVKIVDKTKDSEITTGSALQVFFEDDKYTYSYSSIKSDYVIVQFENGVEMTVQEALKIGYISISHLDAWDIDIRFSNRTVSAYFN